ncbi:MAG: uncharacterized protein K0R66_540 [Gammaproteobacteria bacterium]|jgi:ankyrin repeat protein|nr:uncharacterized protein [Gammaproteobacteria bacterium]
MSGMGGGIKITPVEKFFDAIKLGKIDEIKKSIDEGMDANSRNNGMSALHQAAQYGSAAIVKLLIEHAADVNDRDNDGCPVLHYVANSESDTIEKFRALLDAGAFIHAEDHEKRTARRYSSQDLV